MAQHNDLGKLGEELAIKYLDEAGYKILEKNWTFEKAEIDVIAEKNGILAIIEVKTRSGIEFGLPQDFVKPAKIKNLVKAVNQYVSVVEGMYEVRFDIIAISKTPDGFDINHLENAFYHF